jgi:hypothetical protein
MENLEDISTVGSEAPTLGTRMTVFTSKSAMLENKYIDTTPKESDDANDVSTVGSGAPTLAKKSKTSKSILEGGFVDLSDGTDSAVVPTFATNLTIRASFFVTSDKDNVVDTTDMGKEDSKEGSSASDCSRATESVFSMQMIKDHCVDARGLGESMDVSTMGSAAPTLGIRMTTKSSFAKGLEGKEVVDTSSKNDDLSSVGASAPTMSSKKSMKSCLTASTHKNQYIQTNGGSDDVSTVGSDAPTVSSRRTVQSCFTASLLEDKCINAKGGSDELSSVGSFSPTLAGTSPSNRRATRRERERTRSSSSLHVPVSKNNLVPKTKSDIGLLGGLLGTESLSSALEVIVGSFLRRGACAGITIWLAMLVLVIAVAPYDSYQFLGFYEWMAHFMMLTLLVGANIGRLSPYLVRERSWEFLKGGAMASNAAVQLISISNTIIMMCLPTPVLVDPITGLRTHLVRWAEWIALAFLMTFLTESIDLPLEDGDTRPSWIHGVILALSTSAGFIFPFCPNLFIWLCVFTTSWVLFCALYIRLFQKFLKVRTISSRETIVEKEEFKRAKYAFKLMLICTILWSLLAFGWSLLSLAHKYAPPESFVASDWLVLAMEDIFQVMSKVGYLSVLMEVHEEMFDEDSKSAGRLQELQNYMSAVWDASSDVVVICIKHEHVVNAVVSPSFFTLEHASNGTMAVQKKSNADTPMTLVMEVDPYDGSFRTFELDLSRKTTREEANAMMKNYKNRTRFVTRTGEKNLAVMADLVCDACTCGVPEGSNYYLMKKDFYAVDKDQNEFKQFCEAKVTKSTGNAFVMILRDVSLQYQLLEAQKMLSKERLVRETDSMAMSLTRRKVEEAMSVIELCHSVNEAGVASGHKTTGESMGEDKDKTMSYITENRPTQVDIDERISKAMSDQEDKES